MTLVIVGLSILLIIFILNLRNEIKENKINKEHISLLNKEVEELKCEFYGYKTNNESSKNKISELEFIINKKDELYSRLNNLNQSNITYFSTLYADHFTLQYALSEKYFSRSSSIVKIEKTFKIKELKEKTKDHITRYKLMEYKYAYLLSIFPELEMFTDDIDTLIEYNSEFNKNISDIKIDYDRTLHYLSKDEYKQLTDEQRNQLALDRYIKGNKSNWQIGRDYEMYIGYYYEKKNYNVVYFGIENNLNDLGRDIIATKDNVTKIIQCKYWSQDKVIREKHIAQLYGTTIQYILFNKNNKETVIPVLVTNTKLSETAKEFAKYLNVEVIENKAIGEYPRIKCNTNRDVDGFETKIYHLPFDQLYDRTKISRKGDLYAFTIKEAMQYGFRRAKKHYQN